MGRITGTPSHPQLETEPTSNTDTSLMDSLLDLKETTIHKLYLYNLDKLCPFSVHVKEVWRIWHNNNGCMNHRVLKLIHMEIRGRLHSMKASPSHDPTCASLWETWLGKSGKKVPILHILGHWQNTEKVHILLCELVCPALINFPLFTLLWDIWRAPWSLLWGIKFAIFFVCVNSCGFAKPPLNGHPWGITNWPLNGVWPLLENIIEL